MMDVFDMEVTNRMIDPMISLAFTLHSKKGTFALMLGSGISRSAGIPTGWDITLDLTNKVAHLSADDISDPVEWYRSKFSSDPDYGDLLNKLYKSPTERSQYLRQFFEPTTEEAAEGIKVPTAAHRGIANLVKEGIIRI